MCPHYLGGYIIYTQCLTRLFGSNIKRAGKKTTSHISSLFIFSREKNILYLLCLGSGRFFLFILTKQAWSWDRADNKSLIGMGRPKGFVIFWRGRNFLYFLFWNASWSNSAHKGNGIQGNYVLEASPPPVGFNLNVFLLLL